MLSTTKKCIRCMYEWKPKVRQPKRCPNCMAWQPPWDNKEYRTGRKENHVGEI